MIGFCKKRRREMVDLQEYFPREKNGGKLFFWSANESDNQTAFAAREPFFSAEWDQCLVIMQGICHPGGVATPNSIQHFLNDFLRRYRESGEFPAPQHDGSYTISILDGKNGKAFLYRHFVGGSFTYYTMTDDGLFWSDNFWKTVQTRRSDKQLHEEMLPVLFLGRYPTGNQTLIQNVFRLSPGELVAFDGDAFYVKQITTLKDFVESHKTDEKESIERIEVVTTEILHDWGQLHPNTVNLLSGGVDSTYLQIHWNDEWSCMSEQKPLSACVWLDHPFVKGDLNYANSAAELLQTEHITVQQPELSPEQMTEIIGRNGEFPNHVQSFYFDTLAKGLKELHIEAGMIGEGADGLFGNGLQDTIREAIKWRERLPSQTLRRIAAFGAEKLGHEYAAENIRTAQIIDQLENPHHPVNQAAVFTDYPTVFACFGESTVRNAVDYKLNLLQAIGVPDDSLHFQWSLAAGYYWEAVVSASYWSKLFAENGLAMCTPYLDSRLIRAALNMDLKTHFPPHQPKRILKQTLLRHIPPEFVNRPKLGFGQPIFEWLSLGGVLRERAESIRTTGWFSESTKQTLLKKPNWFLWTMLCYDIWYDVFFG
ncbi:MAG: asparagine synthase C-terminal domain-containing protein [Planctomycetaceae bacterium]|jgi:asparagine synthase (glutamine-hydrolysing)|nr:asparagine synthase C-terminal domain-containing protein [Planctomycetaceae bacterium]